MVGFGRKLESDQGVVVERLKKQPCRTEEGDM